MTATMAEALPLAAHLTARAYPPFSRRRQRVKATIGSSSSAATRMAFLFSSATSYSRCPDGLSLVYQQKGGLHLGRSFSDSVYYHVHACTTQHEPSSSPFRSLRHANESGVVAGATAAEGQSKSDRVVGWER